jgi:hypothetical protein
MTGWNTAKRRYWLVHQAAADIARNGQRGLTQWQPAIETEYGIVDNFLRDIQRRYFTTVLARLDPVIETNPSDPQAPIAAVFAEVARVHPDLWQVLRDHAGHPALAEGSARFCRSVLAGTGVDPAALLPGGSPRDMTGPTDFEADHPLGAAAVHDAARHRQLLMPPSPPEIPATACVNGENLQPVSNTGHTEEYS